MQVRLHTCGWRNDLLNWSSHRCIWGSPWPWRAYSVNFERYTDFRYSWCYRCDRRPTGGQMRAIQSPNSIMRSDLWSLDILSLQQPSGVFAGDSFGETDTRFSYCAINALSLLGHLSDVDVEKTVSYIRCCKNFDGGFGASIGAESHAAQGEQQNLGLDSVTIEYIRTSVFVCVAALAILDKLDEVDQQTLSWWLAERQLPNGGLNGRPEKLEDVCSIFVPLRIQFECCIL